MLRVLILRLSQIRRTRARSGIFKAGNSVPTDTSTEPSAGQKLAPPLSRSKQAGLLGFSSSCLMRVPADAMDDQRPLSGRRVGVRVHAWVGTARGPSPTGQGNLMLDQAHRDMHPRCSELRQARLQVLFQQASPVALQHQRT